MYADSYGDEERVKFVSEGRKVARSQGHQALLCRSTAPSWCGAGAREVQARSPSTDIQQMKMDDP